MNNKDKNMGKIGKDKITGFVGTITAKCSYITGCDQYGLTPEMTEEGKYPETLYLDVDRIEIIDDNVNPDDVIGDEVGGPERRVNW